MAEIRRCPFRGIRFGIRRNLISHSKNGVIVGKRIEPNLDDSFPTFYGTRKFHNSVHNNPTLVPILIQMKPFHTLTSYFLQIHFNIILRSIPRSPFLTLLK
jgi:hypothetical protein